MKHQSRQPRLFAETGSSLFSMESLVGFRLTARLWPFAASPRLGDPSEPSLAPQIAEPLAPDCSKPCTRPSRGPHRIPPVTPLIGDQRYYGGIRGVSSGAIEE